MGISTKASIFVGLPREDFEDDEQLQEWLDNGDLDCCSPYFDGCGDDSAICGIEVVKSEYSGAAEFVWDQPKCDKARSEFKELTGLDAKVWLSPYVY